MLGALSFRSCSTSCLSIALEKREISLPKNENLKKRLNCFSTYMIIFMHENVYKCPMVISN